MKNKIVSILLSLILAFGLWYYVITVVSPGSKDTFYDIPVVLVGETALEERGLMVTAVGNTTVDLTLSGNRSDLNQLTRENITIKANLNNIYDPGTNIPLGYSITYPGYIANNAFVEENKSPSYITVTVEKRLYKDIPVNVQYVGAVPEGFADLTEEASLDNSSIRISGPASVVGTITQAVIEVPLTDRTESIHESFKITLCDQENQPVNSELITVSVEEVELNLPIRLVKTVPLVVHVVNGGGATEETTSITINPAQIEVHGTRAALEDLDEIVLGTIYLADYARAEDLKFDIILPEGVTNRTGYNQATVSLRFPELATKTLKVMNMQAINVTEGLTVELTTKVLEVVVRGPVEEIANITAADVQVIVDLAGAQPGSSSWKVQINIQSAYPNCGALGSYSVYANVLEETEVD